METNARPVPSAPPIPPAESHNFEQDVETTLILAARRYWMTKMGLSPEEIEEHCNLDEYPGTLDDELKEIAAMKEVAELNCRMAWNT